jgi:hypothetical protein
MSAVLPPWASDGAPAVRKDSCMAVSMGIRDAHRERLGSGWVGSARLGLQTSVRLMTCLLRVS